MPSPEQLQKIRSLNDSVLYPEAVAFIRRLVNEQECSPLPTSQVMGLLNIANAHSYSELERFIRHQRERDWQESKKDIRVLYEELQKFLTTMKNKWLKDEFHLVSDGLSSREARQESDELMALLSRDFIQHLVAENGMLAARQTNRQARRKW
jgi:hypothetical protein